MKFALRYLVRSKALLYLVCLLPGWELVVGLISGDRYHAEMMYISGVRAIQFLVITLAITPASRFFVSYLGMQRVGRWLVDRRRDLGWISFIYASLHLVHYLWETADILEVWLEFRDLEIATGWGGFFILLALATTSGKTSKKKLGTRWKPLHRAVYLCAALSLVHWYLFAFRYLEVIVWLAILVAFKSFQFFRSWHTGPVRQNNPAAVKP